MEAQIKHKDAIYTYVDGGLIKGYTKRGGIPEGVPFIKWHGAKMPHALWRQILAFFAWTYDTGPRDESLVYLYYNEATENWLAWAPPQKGIGMTVNTIENHPNWSQAEAFVGYVKVGTGHHHNASSAFQSSTDKNDEESGNGLHFTVGHMDKTWHDLHARAVFNGNMIETSLHEWVELADKYKNLNLPPELLVTAYDYSLKSCADKEVLVPQQWKDNFIKSYQAAGTMGYVGSHTSNPHAGTRVEHMGTTIVNGVEGYFMTENGARVFKPFSVQTNGEKKYQYTPSTKTPSEKAEAALDALTRSGVTMIQLAMIAEDLKTTHRSQWTGDKDTLAVIEIINSNGLNVRWLEKYIEDVEVVAGTGHQQQWDATMFGS